MVEVDALKRKSKISYLKELINYKSDFYINHPNYFWPDGFTAFVGPQGSGKTLSAVLYVSELMRMYPKCKLVTNINIRDYPIVTFDEFKNKVWDYIETLRESKLDDFQIERSVWQLYKDVNRVFPFIDNDDLTEYKNGEAGVIFFIDEIQLYMDSLNSKNINPAVMNVICQQRKQRIHIVGTVQVFGRLAKPLREQFSTIVVCHTFFHGMIQRNALIDRDSLGEENGNSSDLVINGTVKEKVMWIHRPGYYNAYDTYSVLQKGVFCAGEDVKRMGGKDE